VLAHETNEAMQTLVERTAEAGSLREDITNERTARPRSCG
jgi:hypothetical protein